MNDHFAFETMELPSELWLEEILRHFTLPVIATAKRVCRAWHNALENQAYWKRRLAPIWPSGNDFYALHREVDHMIQCINHYHGSYMFLRYALESVIGNVLRGKKHSGMHPYACNERSHHEIIHRIARFMGLFSHSTVLRSPISSSAHYTTATDVFAIQVAREKKHLKGAPLSQTCYLRTGGERWQSNYLMKTREMRYRYCIRWVRNGKQRIEIIFTAVYYRYPVESCKTVTRPEKWAICSSLYD